MDTTEKGWQENRDEYIRKAYASVNAESDPLPMNEALDNWKMLTNEASNHYFWKALGLFRLNESLDITEDSGNHLFRVDPEIELSDLDQDIELVPGEGENVRKVVETPYSEYRDLEVPEVPLFLAWEHFDRHGYDVFPHEDPELRGLAARNSTSQGTEEKWMGFYNHDGEKKGTAWINQVFKGLEIDGNEFISTEDVFTDRNRQHYTDKIWESEPLKIRRRLSNVWDAARETVEEELPRRVEQYSDRWNGEIDEREALKREMRLIVGDDEFEENGAYIERIANGYWEGELERASPILEPFLENIESTPYSEGDMNYSEATTGSDTSKGKKERNRAYMEHFLDLVWQMSEEAYLDE